MVSVVLQTDETPRNWDIYLFLRDRMRQTWGGLEASQGGASAVQDAATRAPKAADSGPPAATFTVVLAWLSDVRLSVRVLRGNEVLAQRKVEAVDAEQAKIALWLVVKSAIQRSLQEEIEPPCQVDGPDLERQDQAATPPPAAIALAEPLPRWGLHVLASGAFESQRLSSAGGSVGAQLRLASASALALELGYRVTPRGSDIRVHHLPCALLAAWQPHRGVRAVLAAALVADIKLLRAGGRRRTVVGAEVGLLGQSSLVQLSEATSLALRLGIFFRPLRYRYVLDQGEILEGPWSLRVGAGLSFSGG